MLSTSYRQDRGVSPVIGVILIVAITVILAAIIAGFVMDLGNSIGEDEARAGVAVDVHHDPQEIDIRVVTLGNAEYINISGTPYTNHDNSGPLGDRSDMRELTVGDEVTIDQDDLEPAGQEGTVTAVAVNGDTETQVGSEDYNFT
ncbi:type IV pilin [Natrinema amylolyticum]|uniref:type IV pilin n=1 Tax=Natrinema amylolyticum TaxID=2878679 RepID=UPI001CF9AB87|nr:type IV pilin N-terminal domain-containing protein [Natrinema amylolyticum]